MHVKLSYKETFSHTSLLDLSVEDTLQEELIYVVTLNDNQIWPLLN